MQTGRDFSMAGREMVLTYTGKSIWAYMSVQ